MAATTFDVLAEPRRRDILDLLRVRERSVGELVEGVSLSQPGVSKHLRVLREAGLVEVRVDAQRRWYRVRAEPLAEIDAWLAPYRRFWTERPHAPGRPPHDDDGTPQPPDTPHKEGWARRGTPPRTPHPPPAPPKKRTGGSILP